MVEIRRLNKNDSLTDLIELSRAFFSEYEVHHPDFFRIDDLQDIHITGYFSHWIDQPDGDTFIAVHDGKIIAYITVYIRKQADFWQQKRVGEISGLMVAKQFRRNGIARQLCEHANQYFAAHGVQYTTVYTAATNQIALAFYTSQGMQPLYTTLIGKV